MSRITYDPIQRYTGTGSLDEYTFDFKITKPEQLLVVEVNSHGVETQRVRGDDLVYLAELIFDPINGGGTVKLAANLEAGYKLFLILDSEPVQEYEFRNKTSFTLRRFEDALDAIVGAVQSLAYKISLAFKIHDADAEAGFDLQLPPGITDPNNANRVFQTNEDATGLKFGPTTDEIANAQEYALDAKGYAQSAEEDADTAEDAALEAQTILFDGNLVISHVGSPYTWDETTYNSKIVNVNADAGSVVINLKEIAAYPPGFKFQLLRTDQSANTVTVIPADGENIDNQSSWELPSGVAVIISIGSEIKWVKKFLAIAQGGGGTLPEVASPGDYLENDGSSANWVSGAFSGFSGRFNTAFDEIGVRNALLKILDFSYLAPQVSLSATGSTTVREKGSSVTSSTLSASITKRTDAIAKIEFFIGNTSIYLEDPAVNTGSGTTNYNWSGSFSDNTTFKVEVTDTGESGGPTIVTATRAFTFVYPYYSGTGAPSLTASNVAGLTKDVRTSTANLNKSFTTTSGQVFYFAYPASYGALSSVLDENGFETISSWTLRTENITGLDSTPVSYRIYEFNLPQGAGSTNFTFIR